MSESTHVLQAQSIARQAQLCALNAQLALLALFKSSEDEEATPPKITKTPHSKRKTTVKVSNNHVPVRKQFRTMQPRK